MVRREMAMARLMGEGDGDDDGDMERVGKCAHAASGGFL